MPDLGHYLPRPVQCQANGIEINECPKMYCRDPTEECHAIIANDDDGDKVVIPLFLRGITSLFGVQPLSLEEFEEHTCPRMELISSHLTWDPSTDIYQDQENATLNYKGDIVCPGAGLRRPLMVINSVTTSTCEDAVDIMSADNFREALREGS